MVQASTVSTWLITWAFGVHLPLVYSVLGLLWLMPFMELLSSKNQTYGKMLRPLYRYLITIYAIGGVFGTIVTVFLAGLMPVFTNLAGVLLWPIWATAILAGVVITIPLIGLYYRSFGRWGTRNHVILGIILAISATTIPAMFRLVFAYTAYPYGTSVIKDASSLVGFDLKVNVVQALGNPLYPPIFLATVFAAIALTGSAMAFGYYLRGPPEYREAGVKLGSRIALIFGILYVPFAALYLYELGQYSPTIYWAITGHPPSSLPSAFYSVYMPTYNLSWALYLGVALAALYFIVVVASAFRPGKHTLLALPLALAILELAEGSNLMGHMPYAVVPPPALAQQLIAQYGLQFTISVAKTLQVSTLSSVLDYLILGINSFPALLYISIALFTLFNALIVVVVYISLAWRQRG